MTTTPAAEDGEQLTLVPAPQRRRGRTAPRRVGADPITDDRPVAVVQVDTGLAHLDRPFEYAVPESLAATAEPGVRVKVRFAGRDLDAFVLERRPLAEHPGRLAPLRSVVSPEPVLLPQVIEAARRVADAHGGGLGDVLRLAVPPRHATAERALVMAAPEDDTAPDPMTTTVAAWEPYAAGPAFLGRVTSGEGPGAAVLALPGAGPGQAWPDLLAEAAAAAHRGDRGALLVVPDHRDVSRVSRALDRVLGPGRHVRLTADQGPQARYTAYLKVLRGHAQVVVGTRAAAWAPVARLGLVAWWDDGDDLHEEPRFPHAHVRDVLLARAEIGGAAVLTAGYTRSLPVEALLRRGVLTSVDPAPRVLRARAPRVRVAGEGSDEARDPAVAAAHLPTVAWTAAKEALTTGPVLVQVPRRGYLPALACQDCRRPARCVACAGPLGISAAHGPPACRWCGRVEAAFICPACHGRRVRSSIVGARRTAEELGRAFPGVPVDRSGADTVLETVPGTPRLVVATPGAEPVSESGYAAVLLLDAWALLDRASLLAGEESLRRWMGAAALARPSAPVVLCGAPVAARLLAVEALVRWDPAWFAAREWEDRDRLGLPPTALFGTVVGSRVAVGRALSDLRMPSGGGVLGPLPTGVGEDVRAVVRVPHEAAGELARELAAVRALASARKDPDTARVHVGVADPLA